MLNLFGAIATGLGKMLPGYLNGYRMAIQDNWNDLNQYNKVQQGQIANAFSEDTFPLAYNIYADRAGMSRMAALNTGIDFTKRLFGLPGEIGITEVNSAMGPGLQMARNNAAMQNFAQAGQQGGLFAALAPYFNQWFNNMMGGNFGGLPQNPAAPQDPNATMRQTLPTAVE